ncbi:MAG: DUF2442 domain-containing protein [Tannerella sp.]|jgi:hypothetical protein|nr:DUF2442 domain-containing protein [Tannerella sp.]
MEANLENNSQSTSVSVLMINAQGILISVQGDDFFVSYERMPWLRNARVADILDVHICGRTAIEWKALGLDLEIESLKHPERYPLIMASRPLA